MASDIDATKPAQGSATTLSVRENFAAAKAEILDLQSADTTINGRIDNRAERAGDLGGTATSTTVTAIQNRAVTGATPAPVAGQPLTWNATPAPGAWTPMNVSQVQGVAVSATAPTNGQQLRYDTTAPAGWKPATNTVTLTGDVTASGDASPAAGIVATVARIQGRAVTGATPAPAANQALTWNGTAWTPQNVAQLQGVAVSTTAPSVGQVLTYQTTPTAAWVPTTAGAGLADAPNDGVAYGRESGGWMPVRRVYRCSGTNDGQDITAIVQDFFAGTDMTMELIITGRLMWPVVFDFNSTNGRGAVLTIDFTECHIPDADFQPHSAPFILFRGAVNIVIRGLNITLSYEDNTGVIDELFVIRNDSTGRIVLDRCHIVTAGGPTTHVVYNTRNLTLSNSYILGGSAGAPPYCVENRGTNAYLHVSNSYLNGSASGGGYGLYNDTGYAMVTSSRLNGSSGGTAYALYNISGTVMISSCYLQTSGNSAATVYNDSGRLSMAGCFVGSTQSGGGHALRFQGTSTTMMSAVQSVGGSRSGFQVAGSARVALSDCQISGTVTATPLIDVVAAYTGTLKLMNCRFITTGNTNMQVAVTGTANIIVHGCEFSSNTSDISNTSTNTNLYWNVVGNIFSKTNVTLHNAAITDSTTATRYMPTNANRFGQTITA